MIHVGDAHSVLLSMPADSIDCVVTSPPYWGLRSYRVKGQLGIERTVWQYIDRLASIFDEVRRVLKPAGTCWLNLGDTFSGKKRAGFQAKDIIGVPWRVVFELQARGWIHRLPIIWQKTNILPDPTNDRPTLAHEYVFMLTKTDGAFYDIGAAQVPVAKPWNPKTMAGRRLDRFKGKAQDLASDARERFRGSADYDYPDELRTTRNLRSVWSGPPAKTGTGHFAVMPGWLAARCITIGCPEGGTVLDPFGGMLTTAIEALRHGRKFVAIELKTAYADEGRARLKNELGLMAAGV